MNNKTMQRKYLVVLKMVQLYEVEYSLVYAQSGDNPLLKQLQDFSSNDEIYELFCKVVLYEAIDDCNKT